MGCGDVEKAELVGPGRIIDPRGLDRIAGVLQVHEIDALDHPAIGDVETGNDAGADSHADDKHQHGNECGRSPKSAVLGNGGCPEKAGLHPALETQRDEGVQRVQTRNAGAEIAGRQCAERQRDQQRPQSGGPARHHVAFASAMAVFRSSRPS